MVTSKALWRFANTTASGLPPAGGTTAMLMLWSSTNPAPWMEIASPTDAQVTFSLSDGQGTMNGADASFVTNSPAVWLAVTECGKPLGAAVAGTISSAVNVPPGCLTSEPLTVAAVAPSNLIVTSQSTVPAIQPEPPTWTVVCAAPQVGERVIVGCTVAASACPKKAVAAP